MKLYYVYIMTNRKNGVLYTGMTSNLPRRVQQHKDKVVSGFTSRYNCTRLVYYDSCTSAIGALEWERRIKGWVRKKKIALIEASNPEWKDLSEEWSE